MRTTLNHSMFTHWPVACTEKHSARSYGLTLAECVANNPKPLLPSRMANEPIDFPHRTVLTKLSSWICQFIASQFWIQILRISPIVYFSSFILKSWRAYNMFSWDNGEQTLLIVKEEKRSGSCRCRIDLQAWIIEGTRSVVISYNICGNQCTLSLDAFDRPNTLYHQRIGARTLWATWWLLIVA